MDIEVRLFATFRDYLPEGEKGFAVPVAFEGEKTAGSVLADLGIPSDLPRIIVVEGSQVGEDYRVSDGDVISVFPPLGGG